MAACLHSGQRTWLALHEKRESVRVVCFYTPGASSERAGKTSSCPIWRGEGLGHLIRDKQAQRYRQVSVRILRSRATYLFLQWKNQIKRRRCPSYPAARSNSKASVVSIICIEVGRTIIVSGIVRYAKAAVTTVTHGIKRAILSSSPSVFDIEQYIHAQTCFFFGDSPRWKPTSSEFDRGPIRLGALRVEQHSDKPWKKIFWIRRIILARMGDDGNLPTNRGGISADQ